MKYTCLLALAIVFTTQKGCAQQIEFKDQNLKSALLKKGYDFNKDGQIEVSEIDTVKKLNVSKSEIKSLDDLTHFKSLISINANDNQIKNLDVFFNNGIIKEIYIVRNALGKKLILKDARNLTDLAAANNNIEEIDLTGTENIKSLYLQGNAIKTIVLKKLLDLQSLDLMYNSQLKLIDISANHNLNSLYLLSTGITKLDVTGTPLLETLYVDKNVSIIKGNGHTNVKAAPIVKEIQ
jgi:Leucine-rich repeat (LRR) protein